MMLIRHALLLGVCVTLVACAAIQPEPRQLLLAYQGPLPAAVAGPRPRLVVRAVTVPDYLDRRVLVYRGSGAELKSFDRVVWAERPAKSITRWVAQALASQRSDYSVQPYASNDGRAPDAVLNLTLDAFELQADGILRLRGNWDWAMNGQVSAASGRFDADVPVPTKNGDTSVAAMQIALQSAVKMMSAALPTVTTVPK